MSSAISPSQRTDSRLIAGTNRGTEALRTGTAQGLPEDDLSLHLLQRGIEGRALVVPPYPSDVAAVEACAPDEVIRKKDNTESRHNLLPKTNVLFLSVRLNCTLSP